MEGQPLFPTERSCVVFVEQSFLQCITERSAKNMHCWQWLHALVSCNNMALNKHPPNCQVKCGKAYRTLIHKPNKDQLHGKRHIDTKTLQYTSSSSKDTWQLQHFKSVTGLDRWHCRILRCQVSCHIHRQMFCSKQVTILAVIWPCRYHNCNVGQNAPYHLKHTGVRNIHKQGILKATKTTGLLQGVFHSTYSQNSWFFNDEQIQEGDSNWTPKQALVYPGYLKQHVFQLMKTFSTGNFILGKV